MTNAKRNYYIRLNNSIQGLLATEGASIATRDPQTTTLQEAGTIQQAAYVNVSQVPNVRVLPLGTDNFGRDVLTELVTATRVSLLIGFSAGHLGQSLWLREVHGREGHGGEGRRGRREAQRRCC